ncbi:transmembrane protein 101 isoform X1 [Arapaima gigas]
MMRKLFTLRRNALHRATEEAQDPDNLTNSSESSCGKLEDGATPRVRGVSFTPSHFLNVSPVVLSLLQHLNDEEWDRIEESMHSSMTRSQFTTLCTDIVGWVSEAATKVILPALALVLDVTVTESSSSSSASRSEFDSQSTKELSGEEGICEAREAEEKSRLISSEALPPAAVGAVAAEDGSACVAEERSSGAALEASLDTSAIPVDVRDRLTDSRAPDETPVRSLQDSRDKRFTSYPVAVLGQLHLDGAASEVAVPLLAEDLPAATASVSLKSDTDGDSAASDIVTIVLRDVQSLSELDRSFDDFAGSATSGSTTPKASRSIFETVRCKIKDFFSDLHPLSLNKLTRGSGSKESLAEKTPTSSLNAEPEIPVSGAEHTATNIVDVVLHWINQDVGQITPVTPRTCKSGPDLKFDMLLSKENIQMLSPQLVNRVHRLIMEDSTALPVITLAARRVNSDSAILKARSGRLELARGAFSELVYIFTEKCVRKLLQECLRSLSQPRPSDNAEDFTAPVASSSLAQAEPRSASQSEILTILNGQSPKEVSTPSVSSSIHVQVVPTLDSQETVSKLDSSRGIREALKSSLQLSSPSMETLISVMAQEVIKLLPEKIDGCNHVHVFQFSCGVPTLFQFLNTNMICESAAPSSEVQYSAFSKVRSTNSNSPSGSELEVRTLAWAELAVKERSRQKMYLLFNIVETF